MPTLNEAERAYLAGLFDGEGYAGVEREFRKDRQKWRHRVVIAISNTDRAVVELFKEKVGHGFITTIVHEEGKNWKPLHAWRCKGGSAKFVLDMIQEFVHIKRPQIELALDGPDTEEKLQALKRLNRRGKGLAEGDTIELRAGGS